MGQKLQDGKKVLCVSLNSSHSESYDSALAPYVGEAGAGGVPHRRPRQAGPPSTDRTLHCYVLYTARRSVYNDMAVQLCTAYYVQRYI